MIPYIIKSSISLIVMFGLYWFLLRQEKLFIFNRVFLIFSILFSLSIPFVSIPVSFLNNESQGSILKTLNSAIPSYSSEQNTFSSPAYQSFTETEPIPAPVTERINYSQILTLLYITGVLLLLVRFLRNIFFIYRQMRMSEKTAYFGQTLVLTNHQINPFCFFNTIFVSKRDYLNNDIGEELLSHEIEHIRQSHSIDVIFIELIKIIYWFNPILILYSRAIRVNHEYLADNGVIRSSSDIKNYADKLINFISCKRNVLLTSGFNPSMTRKRLIMLTKSRSGMINYGTRIFVTINLVAALFMVLSFTPSYSHPFTTDQNIDVFSDKKSEKVIEVDTSQYKIVPAKTETNKADSGIEILTIGKTSVIAEKNTSGTQKVESLIIVDGVIYTKKLDDIPIESVQNLEVLSNFKATNKYGEKGKNGAIEITTKGKVQEIKKIDPGMNFENEWWTPILKKHNIIPSGFNTFEKVFEMGTTNSINDRVVTLENAFILLSLDEDVYRIIKSPLAYHDLDKNIIEAEEGTMETFNFKSENIKPTDETTFKKLKCQLSGDKPKFELKEVKAIVYPKK